MTRTQQLAANLSLAAGSLALAVVTAELALNVAGYEYSPMSITDKTGRDDRGRYLFNDANFINDPELIWRPKAGTSVFNSQGFRGRDLPAAKADREYRIFTVGDSNTLGWAGETGPNWPAMLERLVRQHQPGASVTNAGVWGYSSFQGLRRFRQVLAYSPDMVLVSFGSNDAHHVKVPDRKFAASAFRDNRLGRLMNRFRVGQALISFTDIAMALGSREPRPRVSLPEYRAHLEEMIRLGSRGQVRVILLTRPFVGENHDPLWWKNFGPQYNAATVQVAEQESVPVIDIYTLFKDDESYFADESHFTGAGHERAARLIYERIKLLVH